MDVGNGRVDVPVNLTVGGTATISGYNNIGDSKVWTFYRGRKYRWDDITAEQQTAYSGMRQAEQEK
jgi:hypothetical protein